jgi:hypothetical protein
MKAPSEFVTEVDDPTEPVVATIPAPDVDWTVTRFVRLVPSPGPFDVWNSWLTAIDSGRTLVEAPSLADDKGPEMTVPADVDALPDLSRRRRPGDCFCGAAGASRGSPERIGAAPRRPAYLLVMSLLMSVVLMLEPEPMW